MSDQPRFPIVTGTIFALLVWALWGWTLFVVLGAVALSVIAYHAGRKAERDERDAELQKLLEPARFDRDELELGS